MAWVTEYDMTWRSHTDWGYIYLQRDGGTYLMPLTLEANTLEIRNSIPSWEHPIGRINASFTIINDLSDFYELIPLMTISQGQIKVIITHETYASASTVMFEGYLNCETVDQEMLWDSPIRLSASGYLSKLQNDHPVSVDTLDYSSLIDIIIDCIVMTGSTDPIYVNIDFYENNTAPSSSQTLFNRISVFMEVFWENNIERMSALEILTAILRSFNCYLYWHQQRWYIQHYEDLNENRDYVIYETDLSAGYGYADTGTIDSVVISSSQIHGSAVHKQIGNTQLLTVSPGLKQLDVKLNHKQYFNLFYPDLADTYTTTTAEPTLHKRRQWWAFVNAGASPLALSWGDLGESFRDIENAIHRSGYDITSGSQEVNGLTTRFNLTAHWDTELIIKFKFGVHSQAQFWASGLAQNRTITFYWYLSTYDQVMGNRDFFDNSDDSLDAWTYVPGGSPTVNYNTLEITGADLDPDLHTYEATLTIPIGSIIASSSGDEDHLDLVFRLGHEVASQAGEADKPANGCYYGDFSAAINESPHDNLLEGVVVTDFLEKRTIYLDLFDAGWSYRNSLYKYINEYQYQLAEDWTYDGVTLDDLSDWLMKSKFRLYRIARQKIIMDLYVPDLPMYELMQPWADSKQPSLVFIQLSTIYFPQLNTQQVELYEYDNAEVINLI